MKRNCSEHLDRALDVLKPTLIVLQGISSVAGVFLDVFGDEVSFDEGIGDTSGDIMKAAIHGCPVLAFHHPSYPPKNWGWGTKAEGYFCRVVKPALEQARDA